MVFLEERGIATSSDMSRSIAPSRAQALRAAHCSVRQYSAIARSKAGDEINLCALRWHEATKPEQNTYPIYTINDNDIMPPSAYLRKRTFQQNIAVFIRHRSNTGIQFCTPLYRDDPLRYENEGPSASHRCTARTHLQARAAPRGPTCKPLLHRENHLRATAAPQGPVCELYPQVTAPTQGLACPHKKNNTYAHESTQAAS
jgi:hypothetical protein